jgi:uncharacterized pyridoxal phosphate-containing UPF0001 family protein
LRSVASGIFLEKKFQHVSIAGLMGMASFTEDESVIRSEFQQLKSIFDELRSTYKEHTTHFNTLSMGMSGDYKMAVDCGSNMIRIGSTLFGARNYNVNS